MKQSTFYFKPTPPENKKKNKEEQKEEPGFHEKIENIKTLGQIFISKLSVDHIMGFSELPEPGDLMSRVLSMENEDFLELIEYCKEKEKKQYNE